MVNGPSVDELPEEFSREFWLRLCSECVVIETLDVVAVVLSDAGSSSPCSDVGVAAPSTLCEELFDWRFAGRSREIVTSTRSNDSAIVDSSFFISSRKSSSDTCACKTPCSTNEVRGVPGWSLGFASFSLSSSSSTSVGGGGGGRSSDTRSFTSTRASGSSQKYVKSLKVGSCTGGVVLRPVRLETSEKIPFEREADLSVGDCTSRVTSSSVNSESTYSTSSGEDCKAKIQELRHKIRMAHNKSQQMERTRTGFQGGLAFFCKSKSQSIALKYGWFRMSLMLLPRRLVASF